MQGQIVEDEHGSRWLVTAHMPEVQRAVSVLRRQGFRWIVLPRTNLLAADPPGSSVEALPPIPPGLAPTSLRRLLRLRQCVYALARFA